MSVQGPHPLAAVEAVAGCVANARDPLRGLQVEQDQFMKTIQVAYEKTHTHIYTRTHMVHIPTLRHARHAFIGACF